MTTFLYILFILSCVVLIVAVLLQPGKADAGALFSSSVSSTAFGPRGTQTILAKITIGAAAAFMLVAIALSLPSLTGQRSVVQTTSEEPQQQATPPPAQAPAASPASSPATSPAQDAANANATQNTTTAPAQTAPASNVNTGAPPASNK